MAVYKVVSYEISKIRYQSAERVQLNVDLASKYGKRYYRWYLISESEIFNNLNEIYDILEYGLERAIKIKSNIEIIEYLVANDLKKSYVIFKFLTKGSHHRKDFPFSAIRV